MFTEPAPDPAAGTAAKSAEIHHESSSGLQANPIEQARASSVDGEASAASAVQAPLMSQPEEEQEQEAEGEGKAEEEQEERIEDISESLQEDEETRNYMPDFIKKMLDKPNLPPGMTADLFRALFDSVAGSKEPHRPKSDLEFLTVFNATMAIARLMWFNSLIAEIVNINRREAVEVLDKKLHAVVPSCRKEKDDYDRLAKEVAMDYFADPDHCKEFSAKLVRGGFGDDAVDTQAFQLALPSLQKVEGMRKSAIKERDQALKELERSYAARSPDQRLPLSAAALRNFRNEMREDKELERQERLREESKEAAEGGDA
ncbi:hypothetical protein [Bradyrhizobium sp. DOA1]|uniref:hypothetical protein n=1 Tax=Bradyrhizobium sp. DOA1 TaxID=1126616 RepID=UPI00077CD09A|nr:hypothetical protein [Bradyrhizobium sp. DOA1]KYG98112.1 hypothetical protein SE91_05885 [Bradyrhizobium sp. DOA1]